MSNNFPFLLLLLCVSARLSLAQPTNPPSIQWQRNFGGIGLDVLACIRQTSDGGFILGGFRTQASAKAKPALILAVWPGRLLDHQAWAGCTFHSAEASQIQTADDIHQNGYRFVLNGLSNQTYVTEYCADLTKWIPLRTDRLTTSEVAIVDAHAGTASQRFYRARIP